MSEHRMPPRESDDPAEAELSRRSNAPSVSIWLIILSIALLGAVVFVASAIL